MATKVASIAEDDALRLDPIASVGPLPRHVAVIMDGNGRWARARGLPRTEGHRQGVDAVRRTVRAAGDRGIPYLTLFGFSSENWSRPQPEVSFLMDLLRGYIRRDLDELRDAGVRVSIIGERGGLPDDINALIENAESTTRNNGRLHLQVAFNYGGRDEIVRAARRLAADVAKGQTHPEAVSEQSFARYLDTGDLPEPDLLIRTSGEQRISNFLLWQCAYSEFVFIDDLWPDFDGVSLDRALTIYGGRSRRFGGVTAVEP